MTPGLTRPHALRGEATPRHCKPRAAPPERLPAGNEPHSSLKKKRTASAFFFFFLAFITHRQVLWRRETRDKRGSLLPRELPETAGSIIARRRRPPSGSQLRESRQPPKHTSMQNEQEEKPLEQPPTTAARPIYAPIASHYSTRLSEHCGRVARTKEYLPCESPRETKVPACFRSALGFKEAARSFRIS